MQTAVFRKLTCFLLLVCLLFPLCSASAAPDEALSAIPFINQTDARYQGKRYRFGNDKLSVRGCGPSAITNMLLAALHVEDQDTADELLYEMLHLLTGKFHPATSGMDIRYLTQLAEVDEASYPTLAALLRGSACTVVSEKAVFSPADYQARLSPFMDEGASCLVIGKLPIQKKWDEVIDLLSQLDAQGYSDAYLIATYITGGTQSTNGPFRATDGHYITLLFQPEAYLADGSFYLIDSRPQALADEPYRNKTYWRRYPFTVGKGNFEVFRNTYVPTRINPTLIRFSLHGELVNAMKEKEPSQQAEERLSYLSILKLYGEAAVAVFLPAHH